MLKGRETKEMQVAIIAGGLGSRLGPLTGNLPKSMINVLGRPFIEYQFEFLRERGVSDIVLCLGHLGRQIEKYCGDGSNFGVKLKYYNESTPLDTAGALKNAAPGLEDPFFTLYGDSYLFLDFRDMLDRFRQQNKLASMSVYKNQDAYDISNTHLENGLVKQYSKERKNKFAYIDCGVNLFRKEVLELIPDCQPHSMGTLFNRLIEREELLAYEVKERFYEIGSVAGLNEFTEYIRSRK
jgi:NDP-sugar pyrophosphorylase family protein